MASRSKETLKKYFETGDTPSSSDFGDLIDSTIISENDQIWATEGKLGVGVKDPKNNLEVLGSAQIGNGIVDETVPSDGLLVKGDLHLGLPSDPSMLRVRGKIQLSDSSTVEKISNDPSLAEGSETSLITEKAIKSYVDNLLVGSVSAFAMSTPPEGWLECNGYMLSRREYKRLFEKIGSRFGDGDGATTFNLPNLRGEFIRGWDNSRGVDIQRQLGSFQDQNFKSHHHSPLYGSFFISEPRPVEHNSGLTGGGSFADGGNAGMQRRNNTDNRGGSETRPRNIALMYCIKF